MLVGNWLVQVKEVQMRELLSVALLGALGAAARYGIGVGLLRWGAMRIPLATLGVNLSGSLLLGLLMGAVATSDSIPAVWRVPLATGFLGSFTTFSTFSVETIRLMQEGSWRLALLNVTLHLVLGLMAAFAGLGLGRALVSTP